MPRHKQVQRIQTAFRLSNDELRKLDVLARAKEKNRSEMLRELITRSYAANQRA